MSVPQSRELLDSARHKLRIAQYHATALLAVLEQHPPDDPHDELRIAMEAHLEGLAYAGTAAAEKTIRAIDPSGIRESAAIHVMIGVAKEPHQSAAARDFARRFEAWWQGQDGGARQCQIARDIRNDAAHSVYRKAPDRPVWAMQVRNSDRWIALQDWAAGYSAELETLSDLVGDAGEDEPTAASRRSAPTAAPPATSASHSARPTG